MAEAATNFYRSCVLHATRREGSRLRSRLFRWDYGGQKVAEELRGDMAGGAAVSAGGRVSVVVCFPGDRLPATLKSIDAARLTAEEVAEVSAFTAGASPSSSKAAGHVLDLQQPEAIAATLAAGFPTPAGQEQHVFVVFPQHIGSEGYSSFGQLFPEGALTSSGEPTNGTYSAPGGDAVPRSLRAIGGIIAEGLKGAPIASLDLVGFSKGCTVLNQLVADIGVYSARACEGSGSNNSGAWSLGVHYVDGGLNRSGAFLSDRKLLEQFRGAFINGGGGSTASLLPGACLPYSQCAKVIYSVYSTPRQRMDPHRPFLDYERRMMAMHLCGVKNVVAATTGAFMPMAAPRYFVLKGGADCQARDWAITDVAEGFTVRVLEDIPPSDAKPTLASSDEPPAQAAAMMGLKQHMLALSRFGEKNSI